MWKVIWARAEVVAEAWTPGISSPPLSGLLQLMLCTGAAQPISIIGARFVHHTFHSTMPGLPPFLGGGEMIARVSIERSGEPWSSCGVGVWAFSLAEAGRQAWMTAYSSR